MRGTKNGSCNFRLATRTVFECLIVDLRPSFLSNSLHDPVSLVLIELHYGYIKLFSNDRWR